jgi:UDPglucose--hexose-1-phosphate uridylyltransferase
MKKTVTQMADGRELIYYDANESVVRDAVDGRRLPDLMVTSEMRYDPILEEWVIHASQRQDRTFMPPTSLCPLCPTTPANASEIPDTDYDIVVFENRFPSLALTTDIDSSVRLPHPVERKPARGRCEVVVFTSDHDRSFSQLSTERVRRVVDVLADRTARLSATPGIEHVYPFENRGIEIGVTLTHPHGQIYGFPFVAPRAARMLESAARYHTTTGRNLFEEVLAEEQRLGDRVVDQNDTWTAFVPPAARWPIEIHLYPHRKVPDLTALTHKERNNFAGIYLSILRKLDKLYESPLPYIAAWHQAPVHRDRDLAYLHLELFSIRRSADKLKYLAGTESGMAVWINDATPEQIARLVREVGP